MAFGRRYDFIERAGAVQVAAPFHHAGQIGGRGGGISGRIGEFSSSHGVVKVYDCGAALLPNLAFEKRYFEHLLMQNRSVPEISILTE